MISRLRTEETAPKWIDGPICHLCGATFSPSTHQTLRNKVVKKHHCRYCGYAFCDTCSNVKLRLPQIGYFKAVRICRTCFKNLNGKTARQGLDTDDSDHQQTQQRCLNDSFARCSWTFDNFPEPSAPPLHELNTNTRTANCQLIKRASAYLETPSCKMSDVIPSIQASPQTEMSEVDVGKLLMIFTSRLLSNRARGRQLTSDSAANTMFVRLRSYLPVLLDAIRKVEEERDTLERLQDKLNQIVDSRMALDTLREEHRMRREHQMLRQTCLQQQQMKNRVQQVRRDKQTEMMRQSQEACEWMRRCKTEMSQRQEAERQRIQRQNIERRFPYTSTIHPLESLTATAKDNQGSPAMSNEVGTLPDKTKGIARALIPLTTASANGAQFQPKTTGDSTRTPSPSQISSTLSQGHPSPLATAHQDSSSTSKTIPQGPPPLLSMTHQGNLSTSKTAHEGHPSPLTTVPQGHPSLLAVSSHQGHLSPLATAPQGHLSSLVTTPQGHPSLLATKPQDSPSLLALASHQGHPSPLATAPQGHLSLSTTAPQDHSLPISTLLSQSQHPTFTTTGTLINPTAIQSEVSVFPVIDETKTAQNSPNATEALQRHSSQSPASTSQDRSTLRTGTPDGCVSSLSSGYPLSHCSSILTEASQGSSSSGTKAPEGPASFFLEMKGHSPTLTTGTPQGFPSSISGASPNFPSLAAKASHGSCPTFKTRISQSSSSSLENGGLPGATANPGGPLFTPSMATQGINPSRRPPAMNAVSGAPPSNCGGPAMPPLVSDSSSIGSSSPAASGSSSGPHLPQSSRGRATSPQFLATQQQPHRDRRHGSSRNN